MADTKVVMRMSEMSMSGKTGSWSPCVEEQLRRRCRAENQSIVHRLKKLRTYPSHSSAPSLPSRICVYTPVEITNYGQVRVFRRHQFVVPAG
jgi:hypothetical protein